MAHWWGQGLKMTSGYNQYEMKQRGKVNKNYIKKCQPWDEEMRKLKNIYISKLLALLTWKDRLF